MKLIEIAKKRHDEYEDWKSKAKIREEQVIKISEPYKKQIKEIKDNSASYLNFLGIFKTRKLNEKAKYKISDLEFRLEKELLEYKNNYPYMGKFPYPNNRNFYSDYAADLSNLKKELELSLKREEIKKRKNEKLQKFKAIAAKETKKSRILANSVKKQLLRFDVCPYCNSEIGRIPHADHIYPISKGGLSTIKNMVYICADCNLKKGDKTLNQFIRKFKIDRKRIESNLMLLNKEF